MSIILCTMCMIEDARGCVLVQHRRPHETNPWHGITFPGGQVKMEESIVDSAARAIYEKTGLKVSKLQLCGIVEWYLPGNSLIEAPSEIANHAKCIVFLLRTQTYSGKLVAQGEEVIEWMAIERMLSGKLAPQMSKYLKMFLDKKITQAYGIPGKNLHLIENKETEKENDKLGERLLKFTEQIPKKETLPYPEKTDLFVIKVTSTAHKDISLVVEIGASKAFITLHRCIAKDGFGCLVSDQYRFYTASGQEVRPFRDFGDWGPSGQSRLCWMCCDEIWNYDFWHEETRVTCQLQMHALKKPMRGVQYPRIAERHGNLLEALKKT